MLKFFCKDKAENLKRFVLILIPSNSRELKFIGENN